MMTSTLYRDARAGRPPRAQAFVPRRLDDALMVLTGRSVLVVGAAPLVEPLAVQPDERVIVVNGAISSVPEYDPDLWLLNSRLRPDPGWSRTRKRLNQAMLEQGRGRTVGAVVCLPRNMSGAERVTANILRALGVRHAGLATVPKHQRARIETLAGARTPDMALEGISAGVFGIILAAHAGASRVRGVGFSYGAGYHYLPGEELWPTSRAHVEGDKHALANLHRIMGDRLDVTPTPAPKQRRSV